MDTMAQSTLQFSLGNSAHIETDQHLLPQQEITQTQLTMLIAYLIIVFLWLLNSLKFLTEVNISRCMRGSRCMRSTSSDMLTICTAESNVTIETQERGPQKDGASSFHQDQLSSINEILNMQTKAVFEDNEDKSCQCLENQNKEGSKGFLHSSPSETKENAKRVQEAYVANLHKFISSVMTFGLIMFYFYICDYAKIFPQGKRVYSRDTFLFLVFLFFLVGCAFGIKTNPDKILNRDQTEEWKGWMQVMFVWYHYFMAKEWYNWIRVYIACYVWMTGFGNFSFFWIRNDFSLLRLLKMLFRLNFLVVFVALTTNNEYVLYYICAMHTYWFLSVYVFMRIFNTWNRNPLLMALKFAVYAVFNAIIFDIPGMSYVVFRPFSFILGFHDHSPNILHEWSFRAGLDHWACFFGMLCAYNYPHFEAFMHYLDLKSASKKEEVKKITLRVGMIFGCVLLGVFWYSIFMTKEKFAYNCTHPFSSLIPITIFIVGRNIHPVLRSYHIHIFASLGKITLETYLSQLHIYLLSNARMLLVFLPGYPLLNFSLVTITYLLVSHTLFTITNDCSNFLMPNDTKTLLINITVAVSLFGFSSLLAYGLSSL